MPKPSPIALLFYSLIFFADDISFFVGASQWSPGQLAREVAEGYWIPCRGPPEIALHGICDHEQATGSRSDAAGSGRTADGAGDSGRRPLADLWLSMMSACGEEEAELSRLLFADAEQELGLKDEDWLYCCDTFDDDEDDDDDDDDDGEDLH
jgi:Uncharacterized ACR, COG1678